MITKEDLRKEELKLYDYYQILYSIKSPNITVNHKLCKRMIDNFIQTEEYERCEFLTKLINEKHNHE